MNLSQLFNNLRIKYTEFCKRYICDCNFCENFQNKIHGEESPAEKPNKEVKEDPEELKIKKQVNDLMDDFSDTLSFVDTRATKKPRIEQYSTNPFKYPSTMSIKILTEPYPQPHRNQTKKELHEELRRRRHEELRRRRQKSLEEVLENRLRKEKVSVKVPEQVPEKVSEQVPEKVPEKVSEQVPETEIHRVVENNSRASLNSVPLTESEPESEKSSEVDISEFVVVSDEDS